MSVAGAPPAVLAMSRRLTAPFAPGADLVDLVLTPGATPDELAVTAYDFAAHRAQFDRTPEPSYVLRALADVPDGTTVVAVFADPAFAGGTATTVLTVPAGYAVGDALALPLPAGSGIATRLQVLRESNGGAPTSDAAGRWGVTVLLGTMARLLWVLGAERDRLGHLRDRLREQRVVETAVGASLDHLGRDLGVPRFPPTPYSFDAATMALYHLDDRPGAVPEIVDATAAFPGRTPHHGVVAGAVDLVHRGRYEHAAHFGAGGTITVASSADFDISATDSFTVECFVRPDPATTVGTVVSRSGGGTGFSIEVGDVGLGVTGAVRATISDGAQTLQVSAAAGLPTDRFSHVAAVLRRDPTRPLADRWSLVVDGVELASAPAGGLGAVATGDVVIGPAASGYVGAIDETRLSSVARDEFAPALGEADEHYRRRLELFRRWALPTPGNLTAILNRLVPVIDGSADPFVVTDVDDPIQGGHRLVRVWPREVAPLQGIDASGRLGVTETMLWPGAEPTADPALLGRHAHPSITYVPPLPDPARDPALAPPDPQLMQASVALALDRLVSLVAALGIAGTLRVTAGFDQAAADSRAGGRAVLLALPGVSPGRLAALAHRAGFDFVELRLPVAVYAACRPGQHLLLGPVGSATALAAGEPPEVTVGSTTTLTTANSTATWSAPTLPLDASVSYFAIPASIGRGTVAMAAPTDATATLTATRPGLLSVSADLTRNNHVVTVSGCVVVRPGPFVNGASITGDGTTGVTLAVVGPAEAVFDAAYLTDLVDPRVDFGADPDHHRMQPSLATALTRLADQLAADGVAGNVVVQSAFDATAAPTDLASRGRTLRLSHTTLSAGDLAVRAHRAGFDFVRRAAGVVETASRTGDLVTVQGPDEVEVDTAITLTASPDPVAVSATTRLSWSDGRVVGGQHDPSPASLVGASNAIVEVVGVAPGVAWVRASLREATSRGPYAFSVSLRPSLAGAKVSRDDYYLVMNALNTLHPVGVEVRTDALRAAVVELSTSPSGLAPMFTFPPFRLHRSAPATRRGDQP
jgi:hypothetical protein